MLHIPTNRINLYTNLPQDSSLEPKEVERLYFKLIQFKYLSTVSAFCWSSMNIKCYRTSICSLRSRLLTLKGEGKAIPLQAWTGPEGSKMLRLPDFRTIGT